MRIPTPAPFRVFRVFRGDPARPIKAKTPAIVHHQGISRHPQKNTRPLRRMVLGPSLELLRPLPFASLRLRAFALKPRHQGMIKVQSRQKPQQSSLIVSHQGKSRQTPKMKAHTPTPPANRAPLPPALDVGRSMLDVEYFPFFSIKAKTPVIVPHQASSRQTMKKLNPALTSANGAAPYQPRATLWVRPPYATSPARAVHPANQGKNPSNRASSRHIKAPAKKHPSPPTHGAWTFFGASPPPSPLRLRAFASLR